MVQKIFYFHVPSAYAMYIAFISCAVCSSVYLVKREPRWDAVSAASAEVGALFCIMVLMTGPLWARKAWGVYWTWDPRLTTTLLTGLIFFSYLVLRSFGEAGEVERRFAAGLAILGALNLPLIHYSVQRWRGTHPSVITGQGGGLDARMLVALSIAFIFFSALVILLILVRTHTELMRQRLRTIEAEATDRGLLENLP
ncbi:MAG: cytochrome c biogenesis protein CcsA [Deltaproteobacteria bacterium]|nr:cytochrome c biogenesis protein CcsA [Deltaproteobacteria bacterium]